MNSLFYNIETILSTNTSLIKFYFINDSNNYLINRGLTLLSDILKCESSIKSINECLTDDANIEIVRQYENKNLSIISRIVQSDFEKFYKKCDIKKESQVPLLIMSIFMLVSALALESSVIFIGTAKEVSGELVGRVLGTYDTLAVMIAAYWWGTSKNDKNQTEMIYKSTPPKEN